MPQGEHTYDTAVIAIRISAVYSYAEIRPYIAKLAQVSPARLDAWMAVAQAARV